MAASAFLGHALLGLGPGAAFFCVVIAPKSFVVLLSMASAFLWLLVMLATATLLRPWAPLPATQPAYAGALLAAVALEEGARAGVAQLHRRTVAVLQRMSASSGHTFTAVDVQYLAVGWGFGQAALHALVMFGSLLPLTTGHATLYTPACPQVRARACARVRGWGGGGGAGGGAGGASSGSSCVCR
jgi:hypothetical protein